MAKPINFPKSDNPYPRETELASRIDKLIEEYSGELSSVAVVGALHRIAIEITIRAMEYDPHTPRDP